MLQFIPLKRKTIKGGWVYRNGDGAQPLVVWLIGGMGESQFPERNGLGLLLQMGRIKPQNVVILMPAMNYGNSGKTLDHKELMELIDLIPNITTRSIGGHSLGGDGTLNQVLVNPSYWYRALPVSNYSNQWKGREESITTEFRMVVGGSEPSGDPKKRDWSWIGKCPHGGFYRVDKYRHANFVDRIWTDHNWDFIGYLAGHRNEPKV